MKSQDEMRSHGSDPHISDNVVEASPKTRHRRSWTQSLRAWSGSHTGSQDPGNSIGLYPLVKVHQLSITGTDSTSMKENVGIGSFAMSRTTLNDHRVFDPKRLQEDSVRAPRDEGLLQLHSTGNARPATKVIGSVLRRQRSRRTSTAYRRQLASDEERVRLVRHDIDPGRIYQASRFGNEASGEAPTGLLLLDVHARCEAARWNSLPFNVGVTIKAVRELPATQHRLHEHESLLRISIRLQAANRYHIVAIHDPCDLDVLERDATHIIRITVMPPDPCWEKDSSTANCSFDALCSQIERMLAPPDETMIRVEATYAQSPLPSNTTMRSTFAISASGRVVEDVAQWPASIMDCLRNNLDG